ncbi:MAG: dihydroneopterin aldolase [Candidatus Thalassarchaeaceae archaeon]|nr:MAG: diguanylate cyclase [Marine Group II euryarchaeote MED-G37]|tara:strand:+ start:70 stop:471 length:402 start_codon:yes stop_codon:yes gene_type:complete
MTSHSDALMQILSQNQAATSLFLEKVIRQVDIGVHDHELGSLQRLSFDIYVMLSGDSTPQGDEISEVLDYEYLISALDETLNLQRASLLETLANRLLDRILKPSSVEAATVVITKLDVLGGDGQLGCSITRIM